MIGYENHKFRLSLLSNIYLCTEEGPDAPACETEEQSIKELKKTLKTKQVFGFSYFEWYTTWLMTSLLSCCCKQREWYQLRVDRQKMFEEANKKLNLELNLHNLLNTVRLTDFLARLMRLKTY